MMVFLMSIHQLVTYSILIYSVVLLSFSLFVAFYSIGETRNYLQRNKFTDYSIITESPNAPSITLLAPAYNEGKTIIDNVKSLLSIYYQNLEVIIINDGSKDDSLEKLILAYDLQKVSLVYDQQIPTKKIRAIYKSKDPYYDNLIVIDKKNGGKGDALNAGINLASNDYLVCTDADCILEKDSLVKIAKTFLEGTKVRVIAAGAGVRVVNGCEIANGSLVKVKLPGKILPLVQTVEYIRAFLLGRMAWSRLNGLLIISGAFGGFDKEIVIKCGGYNPNTVGEDMELVVRMRRYMEEQKQPYKVTYIPETLCWTEVPSTYKVLGRQRNRWTRGTIETLLIHIDLFFNPNYRLLGLLSYPYWLLFEFLAPVIEFTGVTIFFLLAFWGILNWSFFFVALALLFSFGILYSFFGLLIEVITYNYYRRRIDYVKLVLAAVLEPIIFHPFLIWSAFKGGIDFLQRKNSWGEMTREGFVIQSMNADERAATKKPSLALRFLNATQNFVKESLLALLFFFALSMLEIFYNNGQNEFSKDLRRVVLSSLFNDVLFWLKYTGFFYILFVITYSLSPKASKWIYIRITVILIIIHIGLIQYFHSALVPLGADLYIYSWADIKQTVGATGSINLSVILFFIIFVLLLLLSFHKIPRMIGVHRYLAMGIVPFYLMAVLPIRYFKISIPAFKSEFANELVQNKSDFFYSQSFAYFFGQKNKARLIAGSSNLYNNSSFHYIEENKYPFQHIDESTDVLSPYFNLNAKPPHIVILVIEGLGRAFTNEGAYLGNFTPFIDSLSRQSLYWRNFMSEGGRTFAVLPSLLGSIPFGKHGFSDMDNSMPKHLSLLSLLKLNGYHTSFYYGGDAHFDNMDLFLKNNAVDEINDGSTFPPGYTKLPANNGFTWGYNDKELFRRYFATRSSNSPGPQLSVLLTVATHSPFLINEEDKYSEAFEQRMKKLRFDQPAMERSRNYKNQFASVLYMDDALREFFNAYSGRSDFNNTIFIITGDHRMPEIPMSTKIDRYHVPLLIYSPLLKRTANFASISTHFDITPSLLAFLQHNYLITTPTVASWMGDGLDTARVFRNVHSYPLMQTKNDLVDFIMGSYHLNGDKLFRLKSGINEDIIEDEKERNRLQSAFEEFLKRNDQMMNGAPLLNDSVYHKFFPK